MSDDSLREVYAACRKALVDNQDIMVSRSARNAVGVLRSRFSKRRRVSALCVRLVKKRKALMALNLLIAAGYFDRD